MHAPFLAPTPYINIPCYFIQLAQKKGDNALFDKYMNKMTKLCSIESDEDDD